MPRSAVPHRSSQEQRDCGSSRNTLPVTRPAIGSPAENAAPISHLSSLGLSSPSRQGGAALRLEGSIPSPLRAKKSLHSGRLDGDLREWAVGGLSVGDSESGAERRIETIARLSRNAAKAPHSTIRRYVSSGPRRGRRDGLGTPREVSRRTPRMCTWVDGARLGYHAIGVDDPAYRRARAGLILRQHIEQELERRRHENPDTRGRCCRRRHPASRTRSIRAHGNG
jgi:hypothetical protein